MGKQCGGRLRSRLLARRAGAPYHTLVAVPHRRLPMPHLADLHQTVEAALASGRLGTPVFVRYLLLVPDRQEPRPARLAQLAETVSGWIGQALVGVYAPA